MRLFAVTFALALLSLPLLATAQDGSPATGVRRASDPLDIQRGPGAGVFSPSANTGNAYGMPTELDRINAAHVALTGRTNAASPLAVEEIRDYAAAKTAAAAMPRTTPGEAAARLESLAGADARLERIANLPVTQEVVAEVDSLLGIDSALTPRQ